MLRAFLLVVVICGLGCDEEGASPESAVSAEAWADALARMEALERDLAAAQDALSALEASQAAAGMQLTDLAAADAAATARLDTLEARDVALLIDEPLTMDVPADHDTLADAMDWLQDKVLAARVTVSPPLGHHTHRTARRPHGWPMRQGHARASPAPLAAPSTSTRLGTTTVT